jgi:hypothetical protein
MPPKNLFGRHFFTKREKNVMRTAIQIVGILFCCLSLQQLQAMEESSGSTENQVVEKKSKADSNIKLVGFTSGGKGAKGATGPTGSTGTGFSEAYAAAFQLDDINLGEKVVGDIIQLPFSNLDYARNITLDTETNTFTLPKGVYKVDFQFITATANYQFGEMYLTLGGSKLNVAWVVSNYRPDSTNFDNRATSFAGSTIFEVVEENTAVQFFMKINNFFAHTPANTLFIFTDPDRDGNYPTRIVFKKIAELA